MFTNFLFPKYKRYLQLHEKTVFFNTLLTRFCIFEIHTRNSNPSFPLGNKDAILTKPHRITSMHTGTARAVPQQELQ